MRWTEEEEKQLVKLYPNTPANQIARQLSKSTSCIYSKAARLGLKKDPTPPPSMFINNFNLISIEQAKELDEMALFREAWSLYYMQNENSTTPTYPTTTDRKNSTASNNNSPQSTT